MLIWETLKFKLVIYVYFTGQTKYFYLLNYKKNCPFKEVLLLAVYSHTPDDTVI